MTAPLQDALARLAAERADRIAAIVARFEAGDPLAAIGEAFGVTRERIRQIVKRAGCVPRREKPSPGVVAMRSARMRKLHADPAFAAAHVERTRKLHTDPAFAAAHAKRSAERMRKLNADPEFAAAHAERAAERMRKLNADPAFKRKQRLSRIGFDVPDHLLDAYRLARRKGRSKEEAFRIAQESHSAAHSLPCSAASSAAPPAAVPPCAAGLTAGASSDAPAL